MERTVKNGGYLPGSSESWERLYSDEGEVLSLHGSLCKWVLSLMVWFWGKDGIKGSCWSEGKGRRAG